MFVVRWITKLASLPFLWLGQLAGMLKTPLSVPLLKAAWTISGDGNFALSALLRIHQHEGRDPSRTQAAVWMAKRARPEIAAFAGLMAVEAGDLDAARDLLARGRALGDDPAGTLDLLEFLIASRCGSASDLAETARRFESRRDLPPALSRLVLTQLLWDAMLDERFDEARRRAEHLLEVEDVPEAEMALWALARRQGDAAEAQAHLRRSKIAPPRSLYFQALGSLAIGLSEEARQMIAQLREVDASLADSAEATLRQKEAARWTSPPR